MPVHESFYPLEDTKYFFIRKNFFTHASLESILLHVLFGFGLASKLADLEIKEARYYVLSGIRASVRN